MKRLINILSLTLGLILLCISADIYAAGPSAGSFQKRGVDETVRRGDPARYPSFSYIYKHLPNQPVNVFYYVPTTGDQKEMPVLFVLSGAQRVGNGELNPWQLLAERYGIVVINPQFTKEYYPSNAYQFGNVAVSKGSSKINKKNKWVYNIVEELFDYYLKATGSKAKGYYLFGHSAGGQFVGRMVLMLPKARYIKAVAANPSAWTWADETGLKAEDGTVFGWPYSVMGTPSGKKSVLKKVLSRKLYIHIGTQDIGTKSLDRSAGANAQGSRRYDRALNYYDACVAKAKELGVDLGFELAVVQGTRHSTLQAVYGYPDPDRTKTDKEDLGENSAFKLLFCKD